MTLESLVYLSWTLSVIAAAAVLWRLWRERLLDGFPMLASFLAWDIAVFVLLRAFPSGTNTYAHLFFGSRVVTWVLSALVAVEVVSLITRRYPGMATVARWSTKAALVFSVAMALISVAIEFDRLSLDSPIYNTLALIDRTMCVSVVVFIVSAALLLLWFPIRVSRNVVAYTLAFMLMLCGRVAALLALNARGIRAAPVVSLFEMLVAIAVYGYWFAVLRYSYEDGTARPRGIAVAR